MTSRSPKNRRTTAWPTTAPRTAVSLALLAALAGPAAAQSPGNGLAPPPGYRPRTPVAAAPASRPASANLGGRVMYFHKPADSVSPDPSPDLPPAEVAADDARLAVAAPPPPTAARPTEAFVVGEVPAAELPAVPAPPPVPTYQPPVESVPAVPTLVMGDPTPDPAVRTSQKKQDLPKQSLDVDPSVTRLPARDKIFVMYDDATLERAIVNSVREDVKRRLKQNEGKSFPQAGDDKYYRFPELSRLVPPGTVYRAKTDQYPPRTELMEPAYVVHRRLYFEQRNPERGGWDFGLIEPVVSTVAFYKDVLFWPHNLASDLCNRWDTSAGKCLPGSPTPYYIYPPGFTKTGLIAEAGIVAGVAGIVGQ